MSTEAAAQAPWDALDEAGIAFAQILRGLGLLRDEARRIARNVADEERIIFLVDALEALAKAGGAAADRAESAL